MTTLASMMMVMMIYCTIEVWFQNMQVIYIRPDILITAPRKFLISVGTFGHRSSPATQRSPQSVFLVHIDQLSLFVNTGNSMS